MPTWLPDIVIGIQSVCDLLSGDFPVLMLYQSSLVIPVVKLHIEDIPLFLPRDGINVWNMHGHLMATRFRVVRLEIIVARKVHNAW